MNGKVVKNIARIFVANPAVLIANKHMVTSGYTDYLFDIRSIAGDIVKTIRYDMPKADKNGRIRRFGDKRKIEFFPIIDIFAHQDRIAIISSYLGGKSFECVNGFSFDSQGNIILTGVTYSDDYPTTENGYDRLLGEKRRVVDDNKTGSF